LLKICFKSKESVDVEEPLGHPQLEDEDEDDDEPDEDEDE